jgi:hypothetical protein
MVWKGIPSVASIFVPRNGSPSCFSSAEWFGTEFREATSIFNPQDEILRGYFYFLIHRTEFRLVFSSAEGFGTEFREFLFRGTAGIPSSAELFFCRKFPTLLLTVETEANGESRSTTERGPWLIRLARCAGTKKICVQPWLR